MTYNPSRIVKIEGAEISDDVSADIISVSCEDHAVDADMATLTVNNQNAKWVDTDIYEKGKTVEIFLGYGHSTEQVFKGTIVRPELSFPEDGVPTLTVRAYDLSHKMRRNEEKKNSTWENVTDARLARRIASKHGFKTAGMVIDDTEEVIPYIAQGNITDWEFLKERAERIGFELYVDLDDFHFHKPQDYLKRIPGIYEYRNNLKSFEPRLTTQDQVSKVIVKGWNAKKKEPIIAIATSATVVERQVLGSLPGSDFVKDDFGEGTRILHDKVPGTQKEAEEIARAFFRQKEYELIEGHGTCIGDPTLKAKSLISIAGVGQRFSGDYYVTRVSHSMDESGYLCEFDCKRNAVSAPDARGSAKVEAAAGMGYGI